MIRDLEKLLPAPGVWRPLEVADGGGEVGDGDESDEDARLFFGTWVSLIGLPLKGATMQHKMGNEGRVKGGGKGSEYEEREAERCLSQIKMHNLGCNAQLIIF